MARYLLTPQQRIKRSVEFQAISHRGKRFGGAYFVVLAGSEVERPSSRLGITVSKKCSKRAVDRNRLKRVIRESFRLSQDRLHHCDIVVIGRKSAVAAENVALFRELDYLWNKLVRSFASS